MVERKSLIFAVAMFFCFCILPVMSLADTTNMTEAQELVIADNMVEKSVPDMVNSDSSDLVIRRKDSGVYDYQINAYYLLDFSNYSCSYYDGASYLHLVQLYKFNTSNETHWMEFYYCDDDFDEDTLTWNNQETQVTNCSLLYNESNFFVDVNDTYILNITDIVQSESVQDKRFTIKIVIEPNVTDIFAKITSAYYSKDNIDSLMHPRMNISGTNCQFGDTPPTTTTTTTVATTTIAGNTTYQTCYDDNTLKVTIARELCDADGCEMLTLSEFIHCENGCAENQCKQTPINQIIIVIVFVALIGLVIWWFLS